MKRNNVNFKIMPRKSKLKLYPGKENFSCSRSQTQEIKRFSMLSLFDDILCNSNNGEEKCRRETNFSEPRARINDLNINFHSFKSLNATSINQVVDLSLKLFSAVLVDGKFYHECSFQFAAA